MNKQPHGYQGITAYLLGSLPADEAEHFDELSFTDDDFAAELRAAEKDLVDAYVNGELTGPELEQFESYYLASPLRRGKTEFAQAFQAFAKTHAAEQLPVSEKETRVEAERSSWAIGEFFSNLFAGPRSTAQWGVAFATLFVVVIAGWLLVSNSRRQADQAQRQGPEMQNAPAKPNNNGEVLNQPEVSQGSADGANPERDQDGDVRLPAETVPERPVVAQQKRPQQPAAPKLPTPSAVTIASFVLAPQLRGTGQLQTLAIPQKTGWVDLRLELEANDSSSFRVALSSQAGGEAGWRSGAIKAKGSGENRSLNIRIPARLLKSDQIYTLNVSGDGDGGENISNYSFKAVVK